MRSSRLPASIWSPAGDQIDAGNLLDRIDTALAFGVDDAGLTSVQAGNHADLGRPAGRLTQRLTELRALTLAAAAGGHPIMWH